MSSACQDNSRKALDRERWLWFLERYLKERHGSCESITRQFQGVPEDERQLMTCDNAARFYGLS